MEAVTQATPRRGHQDGTGGQVAVPRSLSRRSLSRERSRWEIKQEEDEISRTRSCRRVRAEREGRPSHGGGHREVHRAGVLKIGEGTYGEAFPVLPGGNVLKIVPMGGDVLINHEPQIGPRDYGRSAEAAIAKRLTRPSSPYQAAEAAEFKAMTGVKCELPLNSTEGFINTAAVTVCRGPYAPPLLNAWKKYEKETESSR